MSISIQGNTRRHTFDSLANLRLLSGEGLTDNETADVSGHTTEGDSGGGGFFWDASSTATDDNGTIVKLADTTTGRFIRTDQSSISVKMFGATGDGATDDRPAIQLALPDGLTNSTVVFPAGFSYRIESSIELANMVNVKIVLDGAVIDNRAAADLVNTIPCFKLSGACVGVTIQGGKLVGHETVDGSGVAEVGHRGIQCASGGSYKNIQYNGITVSTMSLGLALGDETSQDVTYSSINNCIVEDILGVNSGTGYGYHLNAKHVSINNCVAINTGRHAYYSAKGEDHFINGCISIDHHLAFPAASFRSAFNIARVNGCKLSGCRAYDAYDGAFHITNDPTNDCRNVEITNCFSNGSKNAVPTVSCGEQDSSGTYFLENVNIHHNQFDLVSATGLQEVFRLHQGKNVSFSHNDVLVGGNLSANLTVSSIGNNTYSTATNTARIKLEKNSLIIDGGNASYYVDFFKALDLLCTSNVSLITQGNTIEVLGTAPSELRWVRPNTTPTNTLWVKELHTIDGDPNDITGERHYKGERYVSSSVTGPWGYICSADGLPGGYQDSSLSSVTATITASTGSAQGGSPLVSKINQISVCANAGDSVTLPGAIAGTIITIINSGAAACDVFPASGDTLGAGANTAISLAANATVNYAAYDTANWIAV